MQITEPILKITQCVFGIPVVLYLFHERLEGFFHPCLPVLNLVLNMENLHENDISQVGSG